MTSQSHSTKDRFQLSEGELRFTAQMKEIFHQHKKIFLGIGVVFVLWSLMVLLLGAFGYSWMIYQDRAGVETVEEEKLESGYFPTTIFYFALLAFF